ncbi:PIR protein CIR protein [Plasmodium vinckei lentum]|uniref:PIR protein CIR protein n=1 Tax=Plasmodium vinckei lentum TaxID=138297 RepID=A0A6V7S213_PLAVN|nr:PIR protein CIR protein [Plasmodium vinckei lentum]
MSMEVPKIFIKADILFEEGKLNLKKINNAKGPYIQSCPYDASLKRKKCKTDLEGILALWSHLFTQLLKIPERTQKSENANNQYVEYAMLWLGYRLFQTESYDSQTLSDFYNNYLMRSDVFNNYNNLIMKKKHLKDANLYYIARYYQLFQQLTYITMTYSKNNPNIQGIKRDSTDFYNKYISLYKDVNECDSYFNLLSNLKTLYENLKKSIIHINRNRRHIKDAVSSNFKNLPSPKRTKKTTTIGFNCEECKKINSIAEKKNPKPAPKPQEPLSPKPAEPSPSEPVPPLPPQPQQAKPVQESPQLPSKPTTVISPPALPKEPENPAQQTQLQSQPQSSLQKDTELKKTQTEGPSHKNGPEDSKNGQTSLDSGKGITDGGGEKGGTSISKGDSGGTVSGPVGVQDDQGKTSGGSDNGPGSGSDDQSNTDSQTKHPENAPSGTGTTPSTGTHNGVRNDKDNPQTEINNLKGGTDSQPTGQDNKQENQNGTSVDPISGPESPGGESKDGAQKKTDNVDRSTPGHQQPSPQGDSNQKGGSSQQGDPDTTNSLDQTGTPDTSEGSFGFGSSFLSLLSNGTNFFNRASDFIDQNQQRINDAKDKISGAYKYTMDNLKSAYDTYSDYLNRMINNINNQLNQDDPPKSGNSGDKLPQSNDQSQKTGDPLPPQPLTPPKDPIPITSQDPSKDSSPTPPSTPTPASPEQKQLSPQSKHITQKSTQLDPPTQKITDNLIKSPSPKPILRTPWNIIPTTWNGSGNCKPKIKFINTTLVCCTPEQCSLTGISVTLILIPIILLIVYKYLSFGSSKKSEKKNMKRVIKLVDGSKKTQIIINSYYRKKNLKPVINSVVKKKDPLLNIYKLMKADPIPFINVFFLLIFFVYKRKENFLEL